MLDLLAMLNRRAAKTAKAEAKKAKSKAMAVGTAEEVEGLVAQLKTLVDNACKHFAKDMHDAAELAFRLQEKYGLTQFQIGARIGRSQQWVSGVLIWRSKSYPDTAFGPQAKQARAKFSPVTGKTGPDPQVGIPPGPKLALLPDNSVVKVTGNDADTEASAEGRKAAASEPEPCDTGADASAPDDVIINYITASAINQKPGAIVTADELSDDALSGFKKACDQFLPAMTVVEDRRKARVYFMTACDNLDKKARIEAA